MGSIRVAHLCANRYKLETRGHVVLTDAERADTIEIGPTPVELLVMAIVSSAACQAVRYVREHGLAHEELRADAVWSTEGDPPRVRRIELTFTPSIWLTREEYLAMLRSVEAGTVMNTLREPPVIDIAVPARQPARD
jgi:uncharacterized OsmC-like protein